MIGGIDESGRGPVLGPLVVAGVTIDRPARLKRIGVKDSKLCTPRLRETLALQITSLASAIEIVIIPAKDIDDLRTTKTLNEIEEDAFATIVDRLTPEVCYVDAADVNEERFGTEIARRISCTPRIVSKHKADRTYPVVSAASIIAKVTRDRIVRDIERELQHALPLPLGSGYQTDPLTMTFLRTWLQRYDEFPPHVRRSWESARWLMQNHKTKKLDEFM